MAEARQGYRVSERRACAALAVARSVVRYRSVKDPDLGLRMRLRELATSRVGYGYRRLHVLLGCILKQCFAPTVQVPQGGGHRWTDTATT